MNELNVLLFSYLISQKSEFLVAVDILLFLVTKYWFKQSKMPQYKGKIFVPDIPQKAGKCIKKLEKKLRGSMPPDPLECSGHLVRRSSNFQLPPFNLQTPPGSAPELNCVLIIVAHPGNFT